MAPHNTEFHSLPTLRGFCTRLGGALLRGFAAHDRALGCRDQIVAFEVKSDAELAAMGLKRADIAQYVFRDFFYS